MEISNTSEDAYLSAEHFLQQNDLQLSKIINFAKTVFYKPKTLNMELITKNDLAEAKYDAEKKIAHYKFVGNVNVKLATEFLNDVVEFSKENKIKGIHCDITELVGTFTMMNDYLVNVYFPALIGQGLQCNSMVVSADIFTQYATNDLIQKMGNFTIRNFKDLDEAYKWVEENSK